MSDEGTVTHSAAEAYPALDTSTLSLDEPDYEQMKEDRRKRTIAAMKVSIYSCGKCCGRTNSRFLPPTLLVDPFNFI